MRRYESAPGNEGICVKYLHNRRIPLAEAVMLDEQEYEEAPDNPVLDECAGMCFV